MSGAFAAEYKPINQQWKQYVNTTKSFEISKHVVWEAFKRVKANKGAVGVDDESIEEFEINLKDNLYKLWNRMSSGSYFPPPVRLVEIPKDKTSQRKLGIPTVADRVCQMVNYKSVLEARPREVSLVQFWRICFYIMRWMYG